MESQQPADSTQEPSFTDLLDETLRLSQPSRRRNRDEDPQERHVLPRIDGEIQRVWYHDLGRDSRCLVILLEIGTNPDGVSNVLFEGSYEGLNNDQITAWSSRPGMGHYRWLRGPINYLRREQRSDLTYSLAFIEFLSLTIGSSNQAHPSRELVLSLPADSRYWNRMEHFSMPRLTVTG
uniref:Predicted protein n=1 Tax=Physcomitrium patens TaxID=3218 RepID=A9U4P7_PHYPA